MGNMAADNAAGKRINCYVSKYDTKSDNRTYGGNWKFCNINAEGITGKLSKPRYDWDSRLFNRKSSVIYEILYSKQVK